MLLGGGAFALVELGLLVYCVLDIVTTPEADVRHLPKLLWLVLVVVLPIVGGIAWLVAGRPQRSGASLPYKGKRAVPFQHDRPGRVVASSPDDDEAFLRRLSERAQEQRRRGKQQEGEQQEGQQQ